MKTESKPQATLTKRSEFSVGDEDRSRNVDDIDTKGVLLDVAYPRYCEVDVSKFTLKNNDVNKKDIENGKRKD